MNAIREEQLVAAKDFNDWRNALSLNDKWEDDQEIRKAVSGIRSKLRQAGGDALCLSDCLPRKGYFSLKVQASQITFDGELSPSPVAKA